LDGYIVSIVRDERIVERTTRAVELVGGMAKYVGKGDRVIIKPNLVDGNPYETGETVHPETVRTLVRLAKAAGASHITVGDCITSRSTILYDTIANVAKKEGAEWVDFNKASQVEVNIENPVHFDRVKVPESLLSCDVLINVPALKTHHLAGVTVAFKNLYGFLELQDRIFYHRSDKIEEVIVDLNIVKPSSLIVVDGGYSTHHWPAFEVQKLDLTIAGNNAVLVDTVAARVMGVDPKTIRYLGWAEERGLGPTDISKQKLVGLPIAEAFRHRTSNLVDYINRENENIKIVNGGACTGCYGRLSTGLLFRHDPRSAKKKLYILMGPKAELPEVPGEDHVRILCGSCLAPTFYNKLKGEFVPGCPPDLDAFAHTIGKFLAPRQRMTRREWEEAQSKDTNEK